MRRIAKTIFAAFLIYFLWVIFHYHEALIRFPYPVSLREGAMMTSTTALAHGLDPFDFNLEPVYMNQYGIIYPLIVLPLAKLFGVNMMVHRLVSGIFILACCALIFLVQRKMKVPLLLNLWGILMLYACLVYPITSTPTIDPGATGMFFYLLAIFVPFLDEYSWASLGLSAVCVIMAFYTKAYFVLAGPVMLTYLLLFVSRWKAAAYGFSLLGLGLASVAMVNYLLPAYFDNCFFAAVNMGPSWSSLERLQMQVHLFTQMHGPVLILTALYIAAYALKFFTNGPISALRRNYKWHCPLGLYAGLCIALVIYKSLGRHNGATLWYFFQLFSPFFLIGLTWLFSRNTFWPVLAAPFLVYNLQVVTHAENIKWFHKDVGEWTRVTEAIREHRNILNSSLIAPLLIEQNQPFVDDGQAEYFLAGGQRDYWLKGMFKEDPRVAIQLAKFFQDIKTDVERKKYDLIILQPSLLPMGVAEAIEQNYKYEGELNLYAVQDRRAYGLTIWKPL